MHFFKIQTGFGERYKKPSKVESKKCNRADIKLLQCSIVLKIADPRFTLEMMIRERLLFSAKSDKLCKVQTKETAPRTDKVTTNKQGGKRSFPKTICLII